MSTLASNARDLFSFQSPDIVVIRRRLPERAWDIQERKYGQFCKVLPEQSQNYEGESVTLTAGRGGGGWESKTSLLRLA